MVIIASVLNCVWLLNFFSIELHVFANFFSNCGMLSKEDNLLLEQVLILDGQ